MPRFRHVLSGYEENNINYSELSNFRVNALFTYKPAQAAGKLLQSLHLKLFTAQAPCVKINKKKKNRKEKIMVADKSGAGAPRLACVVCAGTGTEAQTSVRLSSCPAVCACVCVWARATIKIALIQLWPNS